MVINMKIKRTSWLSLLVVACLLLSACSGELPLNRRMIVQNAGVDEADGEFTLSVNAYLADRAAAGEKETGSDVFFSRSGSSVTNAVERIGLVTGREPYFPHNQAVVIGSTTAENGIGAALSFFAEFFECRGSVPLFIAQGSAEDLLRGVGKDGSIPARELSALSESGVQTGCAVYAEVFTAAQCLTDGERDFCVPILKTEQTGEEEARIALDGTALFSGEKMVARLNEEQTQGVLIASGSVQNVSLLLTVPENDTSRPMNAQVAVENIKTTVRCSQENECIQFVLDVSCDAELAEWDFAVQTNPDDKAIAALQGACEQELLRRVKDAIRIAAQENGSDPFGFGRNIAQQMPEWWKAHRSEWKQTLPECDFSVKVSCNLKAGTMQPLGQKGKS